MEKLSGNYKQKNSYLVIFCSANLHTQTYCECGVRIKIIDNKAIGNIDVSRQLIQTKVVCSWLETIQSITYLTLKKLKGIDDIPMFYGPLTQSFSADGVEAQSN